jgi:hypothetical protein
MKFHLNFEPQKQGFEIAHKDKIFLIGSCFSEEIGSRLSENRFKVMRNPSGILFNPLSIFNCLRDILKKSTPDKKFLIQRGGEYFSYKHHSSIKGSDELELLALIEKNQREAHEFLKEADHLIITFGSAFYYRHMELESGVANCHKQPSNIFRKMMLDVSEIIEQYKALVNALKEFNPKLRVIFTVSPVKYIKDGIVENSVSKSALLLSVNQLSAMHENCHYFPAYELVTDDLRDYRFYKKDLAHPNELAVNYVWQKFSSTFFSLHTVILNSKIENLNSALEHRSLHDNFEEKEKLKEYIEELKGEIRMLEPSIKL